MSSLQKNIIVIMSVKMRMALLLADRTAAQYDGLCGMMLSSVCLSVCLYVCDAVDGVDKRRILQPSV